MKYILYLNREAKTVYGLDTNSAQKIGITNIYLAVAREGGGEEKKNHNDSMCSKALQDKKILWDKFWLYFILKDQNLPTVNIMVVTRKSSDSPKTFHIGNFWNIFCF